MKNILVYVSSRDLIKIKIIDFGFSKSFSVPAKLNTKEELLQWFKEGWPVILKQKRIKKGNPDSMYININFLPVFAKSHKNLLKDKNKQWSSLI